MKRIAIAAQSLDGYITKHNQEGTDFASKEDQQYFPETLKMFDCSLMGAKTFEVSQETILKSLHADRLRAVWTRTPEKFSQHQQEGRLEFHTGSLKTIVANFEARGKTRCAILGGTSLYSECLKENLVDELWLTLEPLAFGSGKKFVEGELDARFELLSVENLARDTLLVKYKVVP
ncbi:MAG: dihydrofolate reductase family protein [Trueperaceae bacterium]